MENSIVEKYSFTQHKYIASAALLVCNMFEKIFKNECNEHKKKAREVMEMHWWKGVENFKRGHDDMWNQIFLDLLAYKSSFFHCNTLQVPMLQMSSLSTKHF